MVSSEFLDKKKGVERTQMTHPTNCEWLWQIRGKQQETAL